ncbi:glutathione S-transferase [Chytriomyces sp. MP71]|nr:glutathione S-transferase [Chytriomyces sp. MP71]
MSFQTITTTTVTKTVTKTLPVEHKGTLYYTTTSCGAANFISAHKAGIIGTKLQTQIADIHKKQVATGPSKGSNFLDINPKGNVPTILLDTGVLLNENVATLQWIADNAINPVAPKQGTLERYKLGWVASELHATAGGLFNPSISQEIRAYLLAKYALKLQYLNDKELGSGRAFLVGDEFTVVDAYAYIVLSWSAYLKVDLSPYQNVVSYFERIGNLDFVKEAHALMAEQAATI